LFGSVLVPAPPTEQARRGTSPADAKTARTWLKSNRRWTRHALQRLCDIADWRVDVGDHSDREFDDSITRSLIISEFTCACQPLKAACSYEVV